VTAATGPPYPGSMSGSDEVRWMSVFLDVPADRLERAEEFWTAVTGSRVADPVGDRDEFWPLRPALGDECLWFQRTGEGPVGVHPDLYVEDPEGSATRARGLGAEQLTTSPGLVVLRSPGGLPFCLVRHRGQSVRPEPVGSPGSRSIVDQICLDIPAPAFEAEASFWAALTGWERSVDGPVDEFERLVRPPQIPYAVLLQRLEDDQPAVTAHVDLACEDRDAEAERHTSLGAEVVRRTDGWTVLHDPVGLTYCTTVRAPGDV
jgi:hypothetical protein